MTIILLFITFAMIGPPPAFGEVNNGDDPWCDYIGPNFELPIRFALDAEALSIELISVLPVPPPRALLQIPREFNKIAGDIIAARSWSLIAALPLPPPGPNNAIAAQNRALHRAEQLEAKIYKAIDKGWITPDEADDILSALGILVSLVGTLPVPLP